MQKNQRQVIVQVAQHVATIILNNIHTKKSKLLSFFLRTEINKSERKNESFGEFDNLGKIVHLELNFCRKTKKKVEKELLEKRKKNC